MVVIAVIIAERMKGITVDEMRETIKALTTLARQARDPERAKRIRRDARAWGKMYRRCRVCQLCPPASDIFFNLQDSERNEAIAK